MSWSQPRAGVKHLSFPDLGRVYHCFTYWWAHYFQDCDALWVLWSMTVAQGYTAELNEWLSGWVSIWPTDFWGLHPAEGPWGVLWSVILVLGLHSGRIKNPKHLWASPTPSAVNDSCYHLKKKNTAAGQKQPQWCEMAKRTNRLNLLLRQNDFLQITGHFENIDELGQNQEANLLKAKWASHRSPENMMALLNISQEHEKYITPGLS